MGGEFSYALEMEMRARTAMCGCFACVFHVESDVCGRVNVNDPEQHK